MSFGAQGKAPHKQKDKRLKRSLCKLNGEIGHAVGRAERVCKCKAKAPAFNAVAASVQKAANAAKHMKQGQGWREAIPKQRGVQVIPCKYQCTEAIKPRRPP